MWLKRLLCLDLIVFHLVAGGGIQSDNVTLPLWGQSGVVMTIDVRMALWIHIICRIKKNLLVWVQLLFTIVFKALCTFDGSVYVFLFCSTWKAKLFREEWEKWEKLFTFRLWFSLVGQTKVQTGFGWVVLGRSQVWMCVTVCVRFLSRKSNCAQSTLPWEMKVQTKKM